MRIEKGIIAPAAVRRHVLSTEINAHPHTISVLRMYAGVELAVFAIAIRHLRPIANACRAMMSVRTCGNAPRSRDLHRSRHVAVIPLRVAECLRDWALRPEAARPQRLRTGRKK